MISAPLLDVFGKGTRPVAGGSYSFSTPYGTAGVSFPAPSFSSSGSANQTTAQGWSPDTALGDSPAPTAPAPSLDAAPLIPEPVQNPVNQPVGQQQDINPPENTTQAWQRGAAARYYERQQNRDAMGATRNPMLRNYYRQQNRIAPGPNNIPGYGTPASTERAQAPVGMGTTSAAGYGLGFPLKFNNSPSGWTPY